MDQNDIDSLLDSVADSLGDSDSPSDAAEAVSEESITEEVESDSNEQADSVVEPVAAEKDEKEPSQNLEQDLADLIGGINNESTPEPDPPSQSETNEVEDAKEQEDSPVPDSEDKAEEDSPTLDNIDDALAQLADEIDDVQGGADSMVSQDVVTDESAADTAEATGVAESEIDDLLAQVTDQLDDITDEVQSASAEVKEPQATPANDAPPAAEKAEEKATEIIEDQAAAQIQEPEPTAEVEVPQVPEASVAPQEPEVVSEPEAKAPEPIKEPEPEPVPEPVKEQQDDFDAALSNYQSKPQDQESPSPEDLLDASPKIPTGPYGNLPLPQRVLVNSLDAANKPFSSVSDETKQLIGFAAVITWLMIMVVAALILYLV